VPKAICEACGAECYTHRRARKHCSDCDVTIDTLKTFMRDISFNPRYAKWRARQQFLTTNNL
jgi:hypothetical protein